jgi:hypothetical protein
MGQCYSLVRLSYYLELRQDLFPFQAPVLDQSYSEVQSLVLFSYQRLFSCQEVFQQGLSSLLASEQDHFSCFEVQQSVPPLLPTPLSTGATSVSYHSNC